jgi:hypothetical protein
LLEKEPNKSRLAVANQMRNWLQDADFAGVRGKMALCKLIDAERRDWQKLWREVEVLNRRAGDRPAADRPARPGKKPLKEKGGR